MRPNYVKRWLDGIQRGDKVRRPYGVPRLPIGACMLADPVRALPAGANRPLSDFAVIDALMSTLDAIEAELAEVTKLVGDA